jgi:hypothetical protein
VPAAVVPEPDVAPEDDVVPEETAVVLVVVVTCEDRSGPTTTTTLAAVAPVIPDDAGSGWTAVALTPRVVASCSAGFCWPLAKYTTEAVTLGAVVGVKVVHPADFSLLVK